MTNTEILDYIKQSFNLKNQGYYKQAIEMLYKALVIEGDNIEILAQLAQLYKLLGNFQRAICYTEKVLDIDSKHMDCMLLLEEIYLIQNNLTAAKSVAEKIHEIQPSSQNLAKIINILNKLKDFDSIKKLESSISDFEDNIFYEIACAYFDNNDFAKALELLESGYRQNNKNEKIMYLLAKIYYDNQEFEKSKKIFEELEKLTATPDIMNYLGLFKLNEKSFTQAINYFSKAQKADAKNPEYLYNLASAYFLNGWADEALKFFNNAICLAPDNVNYRYSLAYLYYQKKIYDKALKELAYIKSIDPAHELSNVLNAMITAKKGDLLEAKNQLEEIIKLNQSDDFAYSALSKIYKELSLADSAEKAIEHAVELRPTSLEYLSELVDLQLGQKKYEEATKNAEKMLALNKNYLYGYIALAKVNLELNDFDKVFEMAQTIIELDQNCSEGYYYNALALFEQGDKNFAIESLKKSISLDLNNAMLYIKMSEFYQELGDFQNAYAWAKEACEVNKAYQYKWMCAKLAAVLKKEDEAVKYYSQSYRLAGFDKDLCQDYSKYLTSIGKEKQAKKILK